MNGPAAKRAKCEHANDDEQEFQRSCVRAVVERWQQLGRTGKPQTHEHTVLAAFLITLPGAPHTPVVVSLGTGTKCLAANKRGSDGSLLNDSHAEVIARRACISWMLGELMEAVKRPISGSAIFSWDATKYKFHLRDGVHFHMYISQPPCGDACIFSTQDSPQSTQRDDPDKKFWEQLGPVQCSGQVEQEGGRERESDERSGVVEQKGRSVSKPDGEQPGCVTQGNEQLEGERGVASKPDSEQPGCMAMNSTDEQCSHRSDPVTASGSLTVEYKSWDQTSSEPLVVGYQTSQSCKHASQPIDHPEAESMPLPALLTEHEARVVAQSPEHLAGCIQTAPEGQAAAVARSRSPAGAAQLISRTGAKPLKASKHTAGRPGSTSSPRAADTAPALQSGPNYSHIPQAHDVEAGDQVVGLTRRKPGKGAPTLSMSCSDKIAKWALLGFQGSMLTGLLEEPLWISGIIVGCPVEAYKQGGTVALSSAQAALCRAVTGRCKPVREQLASEQPMMCVPEEPRVAVQPPPGETLGWAPAQARKSAAGVSINWSAGAGAGLAANGHMQKGTVDAVHEVTLGADGRKAGAAKRGSGWSSVKTRSRLSKAARLEAVMQLLATFPPQAVQALLPSHNANQSCSYRDLKHKIGERYQIGWRLLQSSALSPFSLWIRKPAEQELFAAVT